VRRRSTADTPRAISLSRNARAVGCSRDAPVAVLRHGGPHPWRYSCTAPAAREGIFARRARGVVAHGLLATSSPATCSRRRHALARRARGVAAHGALGRRVHGVAVHAAGRVDGDDRAHATDTCPATSAHGKTMDSPALRVRWTSRVLPERLRRAKRCCVRVYSRL
jgi:hypothetical protein